jgi:hypothetical protein
MKRKPSTRRDRRDPIPQISDLSSVYAGIIMTNENPSHSTAKMNETQAKKPYIAPNLEVLGSLSDITKNVGSGPVDFPMGSHLAG